MTRSDTNTESSKFFPDWGLLAAILLSLLALLPLLTHAGLPNSADGPVHLMRQVELNQAWAEGTLYPRWGTDLALGHGMPIFSYAPPLLYQATQLVQLTGLPLDASMKGVLVVSFVLYSTGMFLFTRRLYGAFPALVAAAVYVYAPYRLREAYIQGNYGQFVGLAFYPLIFWAFHGLVTSGRARYWLAAPLALAGLLFSHNISSMLFAPVFAAYLVFLILLTAWQRRPANEQELDGGSRLSQAVAPLFRAAVAGLIGLGIAAIFWLPAFGERHDIKLEGITQGFFDFRENFISLVELLSPPLPLDLAAVNPEFPLGLGLPQLAGALAGILALGVLAVWLWQAQHANQSTSLPSPAALSGTGNARLPELLANTAFFAVFLLLYTFLAVPASQSVWEGVPLLELAEFPWRMLGPAIFCAAVLSAAGFFVLAAQITRTTQKAGRNLNIALAVTLFFVIALNGYYLYPSQFISWGTPTPADAFAYEISSGAIGTTSTGEFLPRWAEQHPQPDTLWPDYEAGRLPQVLAPATLPAGASAQTESYRSEAVAITIDSPQPFLAILRSLYWPGWQLYLDGQPLPFEITPGTGLLQTAIPAGQHTLILQLESTPLRTTGLWLTVAALLLLAAVFVGLKWRQRTRPAGDQTRPGFQRVTGTTLLVVAGLLVGLLLAGRPLRPLLVLQSDPDMPQPAAQPLRVDFGDEIRLVGVDDWPEVVPAGERVIPVTLYWRALRELDTNYSVFVHLDTPAGETVATVDEVNPEDIPTRNWPPGLYLRNALKLTVPDNLPPLRYNLTTGVYHRDTGERLVTNQGSAHTLGPVWISPATTPPQNSNPLALFGFIELHQVDLKEGDLTLMWRTPQPVDTDYVIFVHAINDNDEVVGQADGLPYDGLYPPSNWLPGQFITDRRKFELPPETVRLAIGLYHPETHQRLPAEDAAGNRLRDDSFEIVVSP